MHSWKLIPNYVWSLIGASVLTVSALDLLLAQDHLFKEKFTQKTGYIFVASDPLLRNESTMGKGIAIEQVQKILKLLKARGDAVTPDLANWTECIVLLTESDERKLLRVSIYRRVDAATDDILVECEHRFMRVPGKEQLLLNIRKIAGVDLVIKTGISLDK